MRYDYRLSDSQLQIANHFAEAYEALRKAEIAILWERSSDTLLLVNAKDVEFTDIEFDDSVELRSDDIETDDIVCLEDENIVDFDDTIYVSPKSEPL